MLGERNTVMDRTPRGLVIERVVEANFEEFLGLIRSLAEYERLDPPDEAAAARLKADGLSNRPPYEAYLGRVDGKPVGYLVYFMTYSSFRAMPTLYLEDIFVLEAFRRCGRMEWCVLNWNKLAISFYEKNGAQRLDWTFYRLTADEIERRLAGDDRRGD
jgi:GNAT superfamily N-acetyltransferase